MNNVKITRQIELFVKTIASLTGVIAALVALFTFFLGANGIDSRLEAPSVLKERSKAVEIQQVRLKQQIDKLQREINAAQKQVVDTLPFKKNLYGRDILIRVNGLQQQIDSVDNRLKLLEQALGDSPSKSLAIPLIKRDIDGLKESEARDVEAIKAQVAAIYDQNKWFIGLMLTLALSMISLVVINVVPKIDFSRKNKSADPKDS